MSCSGIPSGSSCSMGGPGDGERPGGLAPSAMSCSAVGSGCYQKRMGRCQGSAEQAVGQSKYIRRRSIYEGLHQ